MKRNFVSAGAVAALVVMGMALSPAPVLAVPTSIINFSINTPTAGTISYNGSGGPLVGSGIIVDTIQGLPAGLPLACGGCTLSFNTGNFTGFTAATWTFASGGFIKITGAFAPAGIGPGSTLLSGIFTSPTTVLDIGSQLKISGGTIFDTKNPLLDAYYGFPAGQQFRGALALHFVSSASPPHGFTSNPTLAGSVVNTPIPEPASLLLLGSGLLGLAAYGRKKIKNMVNS